MNPGDVVLIRFPFDDVEDYKQRPVLVISVVSDVPDPDLIVLQITSSEARIRDLKDGDVYTEDPVLPKPSVIRCRKVFSLRSSSVLRRLGTISYDVFDDSKEKLRALLAL